MTDQAAPKDYSGMFKPEAKVEPTPDPASAPKMTDRKFGATSVVNGIPLVYDETNSMWVYADDINEPWLGEDPAKVKEQDEPKPDSDDTFVSVNLEKDGSLRLRAEAVDGDVLGMVPNKTALKVINADNPEWPFVEYANGEGEPLRGYVKGSLVVETPAQ